MQDGMHTTVDERDLSIVGTFFRMEKEETREKSQQSGEMFIVNDTILYTRNRVRKRRRRRRWGPD